MPGVVQDYVSGLREVSQTYQEYGDGPSLGPREFLDANLRDARANRPDLSPSERMKWAIEESKAEIMHANEQWEAIPGRFKQESAHQEKGYSPDQASQHMNEQVQRNPEITAAEMLDDYNKQGKAESLHERFESLKAELGQASSPAERDQIMNAMRGVVQQEKQLGGREAGYDESRVADRAEGYGY